MHIAQPRSRWWAFLPALLVLAATVVTAAGISLMPSATAASATQTVQVNGVVDGAINFAVPCGGTGVVNFIPGNFTPGGSALVTGDCAMAFDTNNANGGEFVIRDNDGAAPFFCNNNGATCGGNNEFGNQGTDNNPLEADVVGVALVSVAGGGAVRDFDADDADTDPQPADDSWYGVGTADKQVCHNAAATAGTTCTIRFGGDPKAAQTSGSYRGTALVTAQTL